MSETTLLHGVCRFHFDREAQRAVTPDEAALDRIAALDGWTCFVHEHGYYLAHLAEPGEGAKWADFAGAHELGFEAPENYAPIAASQLGAWSSDEVLDHNEQRGKRRHQQVEELFPETDPAAQQIDLGSMRGMAGIILPGPGAVYHWTCDGVSISGRSCAGAWIPLDGAASRQLHTWGDNIYTNEGELDCELLDGLLDKALPGWRVDRDSVDASCEAAVWLMCERDVLTASAGSEILEEADTDDREAWQRAEWLRSPLADEKDSYQTALVGRRAVLVWGNSD